VSKLTKNFAPRSISKKSIKQILTMKSMRCVPNSDQLIQINQTLSISYLFLTSSTMNRGRNPYGSIHTSLNSSPDTKLMPAWQILNHSSSKKLVSVQWAQHHSSNSILERMSSWGASFQLSLSMVTWLFSSTSLTLWHQRRRRKLEWVWRWWVFKTEHTTLHGSSISWFSTCGAQWLKLIS